MGGVKKFAKYVTMYGLCIASMFAAGCAKSPPNSVSGSGPQLIVSMTVEGGLDPVDDYYYVLFTNTGNTNSNSGGPVPVVAPPWGNGFAAGTFTGYVEFHTNQPGGSDFGIYSEPSADYSSSSTGNYVGQPINEQVSSNTITFQIPLSALATSTIPTSSIQDLQVNFVNTDVVPTDPNYSGSKYFDALGDSVEPSSANDYITIPVTQSATFQNGQGGLVDEPTGDVASATSSNSFVNIPDSASDVLPGTTVTPPATGTAGDLDIVNWSIQVQD
jgi:hypothetical protein